MAHDVSATLREHGIQPSAQRVAVGQYVLSTEAHPSADEVYKAVQKGFPWISRATVYNTLNVFVDKGLLTTLTLAEGRVVFDPNVERHHHFIDEETGRIHDLPWESLKVSGVERLEGVDVHEYQVVVRGRKKRSRRR